MYATSDITNARDDAVGAIHTAISDLEAAKSVVDTAVTASQHILDSLKTSAFTMATHTKAWTTSIAAAQATQQDLEKTALAFSTRLQSLPSEETLTARVNACDKCFDRALKIPTDQEVRNDISNQVEDICDDYIADYFDSQSHNILNKSIPRSVLLRLTTVLRKTSRRPPSILRVGKGML